MAAAKHIRQSDVPMVAPEAAPAQVRTPVQVTTRSQVQVAYGPQVRSSIQPQPTRSVPSVPIVSVPQSAQRPGAAAHPSPQTPAATLNHEVALIAEWLSQVHFRRRAFGGVDEADVWRKFEDLNARYERALVAERARYDALLAEQAGAVQGPNRRPQATTSPPEVAFAGRRS